MTLCFSKRQFKPQTHCKHKFTNKIPFHHSSVVCAVMKSKVVPACKVKKKKKERESSEKKKFAPTMPWSLLHLVIGVHLWHMRSGLHFSVLLSAVHTYRLISLSTPGCFTFTLTLPAPGSSHLSIHHSLEPQKHYNRVCACMCAGACTFISH